jgi:HK97 family phage major capsid protein
MDKLKELIAAYNAAYEKAKDHWASVEKLCDEEDRDPTEDERKTGEELTAQAEAAQQRVRAYRERQRIGARLKTLDEQAAKPLDLVAPHDVGIVGEPFAQKPTIPAQPIGRRSKCFTASAGMTGEEKAHYFAQFVLATQLGDQDAAQRLRDRGIQYGATLSSSTNTAGGALIPDVFSADIIRLVEEYGVFRRWVRVVPMTSDTLIFPRRTGGMTAYWTAESTNPTEADPTFDNVELVAKKLTAMTVAPRELIEDASISLADFIAMEGALAIATAEDDAGFKGDGTSTYGGVQGVSEKINDGNHAGGIFTAASGNTAFSTLDLVDFEQCMSKLPRYAGQSPAWFISRQGWAYSMLRLADAAGGNTKGDIINGTDLRFIGFPVVLTQSLNTTTGADTAAIKLLFGDLAQSSLLGDRRRIALSSDGGGKYFQAGQIAFKMEERIAIVNHSLGDSSNAGAIVALKTPAS